MVRASVLRLGATAAAMMLAATVHGEIPLPCNLPLSAGGGPAGDPARPFIGVWAHDAWSESRPAAVLVERGDRSGHLRVINAVDRDRWRPFRAGFHDSPGRVESGVLTARLSASIGARYRLLPDGRLFARLERHGVWREVRYGIFERLPAEPSARQAALARTDARPWRMVDIPMTDPDTGQRIALKATYYPATTSGPAPLLLMNHGDVTPGFESLVLRHGELARLFVSRGWAVLEMMRRGTGGSGGTLLPELRPDAPPTAAYGDRRMAADIADVDAVLAAVRSWSQIDPARILLGGQSRGGLVALEYLAARPDAAIGAINFAGGIWCEDVERRWLDGRYALDRLARAGRSIRKPTWWFYGDNDRCASVGLIRRWFDAYRAGGGTGELMLFSGVPVDGHSLYTHPVFWEHDMLAILRRLQP
jgi:dienelactone hydrolase